MATVAWLSAGSSRWPVAADVPTLWLSNAANAATLAVRWDCGDDSRAVRPPLQRCSPFFPVNWAAPHIASLLLLLRRRTPSRNGVAREIGGDEGANRPATES
ncbi:hypothetical protein SEVIR_6G137780v4 [Setaria viridis]